MGYQESSNFGSSSNGVQIKKGKGVEVPSNITMISDIEPMLDNITVQGRVISLWHSHPVNEPHSLYSLDFVFQDTQNSRIQVYVKKAFMFRFEPLIEEGKCYSFTNFVIAENSGRLPLLPHKYKISFCKGTIVTRIDPIDDNVHGFILEPFNRLLDQSRVYHEHAAIDVIASVVAIGDVVPIQTSAGRKIHRTVVIKDAESLDCIFWDQWAIMWDVYAQKRNELGHVVFVLQLGKVKYWNGSPIIQNAMFGTKMFINQDVLEILAFRQRVKELHAYDESHFKIEVFTRVNPGATIGDFFHGATKKTVATIRECQQNSHCIVYAKIHKINKDSGWAYNACNQCSKKVVVVETKATTWSGKSNGAFYCDNHGAVQAKSRFKVIMRVLDQSGSTPILLFDPVLTHISGHTAWELTEKYGMDVDGYWPQELDELVGKRFLFKLWYSEYNVINNNHIYRCDAFNDDADMIKHFKAGFIDEEDDDEGFTTPVNKIKSVAFNEVFTPMKPLATMPHTSNGVAMKMLATSRQCDQNKDDGFTTPVNRIKSVAFNEVFTPVDPVVTISEFYNGAAMKMVATIRECQQKSHCIVYAKIHKIDKENGWAYTACNQCNKKVFVVQTKDTSCGKSDVTFYCQDDGAVQAKTSFKVNMHVIDESGSANIVFFNTVFANISGHTALELMEKHGMDVDEYWPEELDELVGKRFLFKLWYSDYNVFHNYHTYRCDAFNDDADLIRYFKTRFMINEDAEQGFTASANRISSTTLNESSIIRVLDLHTPPSNSMDVSGSGQISGGDKKRVFIDLDDIDSEDEDESGSPKIPKLISVKIEKED